MNNIQSYLADIIRTIVINTAMKLNELDTKNVVTFPGHRDRNVKIDRDQLRAIIPELQVLAKSRTLYAENNEAMLKQLREDYNAGVRDFVDLMTHLLQMDGEPNQVLDLAVSSKWDRIRPQFIKEHKAIIESAQTILGDRIKARAAVLGIRVIK